jgi:hypothetical protein
MDSALSISDNLCEFYALAPLKYVQLFNYLGFLRKIQKKHFFPLKMFESEK